MDTKLVIIGIFIIGILAACYEKWDTAALCITGGFALLTRAETK